MGLEDKKRLSSEDIHLINTINTNFKELSLHYGNLNDVLGYSSVGNIPLTRKIFYQEIDKFLEQKLP
ncbi:MAG: hypothetical protein WC812_02340 [Candidatus Pacearchaeota archaeon]|jgi:hypothetical protein